MQEHDVAGEPARLAEIVSRHHHLDAARGDGADDVLDRLGGGGIEARGRLVEQQHGRLAGERAAERQPLLLAAGQPARRSRRHAVETDERQQLGDPRIVALARHTGRVQRVADVAFRASPQHHRALEHEGAPDRRRIGDTVPGDAAVRRRQQPHRDAKQRGLAGAVRPDQHGRRAGPDVERHAIEDGHAAGGDGDVLETDRQIGGLGAHR